MKGHGKVNFIASVNDELSFTVSNFLSYFRNRFVIAGGVLLCNCVRSFSIVSVATKVYLGLSVVCPILSLSPRLV